MKNSDKIKRRLELKYNRSVSSIIIAIIVFCTLAVGVVKTVKTVERPANGQVESSLIAGLSASAAAQIADPGEPDTVRIQDASVAPGYSVAVPIMLFNDEGLSGISMGLTWSSPEITLDSVSYVGTEIEALPNEQTFAVIDNGNRTVIIGFVEISSPAPIPLAPGFDRMAELWYTASQGAAIQQIVIDTAFVPPAGEFVFSTATSEAFTPQFVSGVVNVISDTDGDGVADISDNCISNFNPLQEDFDGDGFGDSCYLPSYLFPLIFVARGAEASSDAGSTPMSLFPPVDAQVNILVTDPDGEQIGADSLGNIINTLGADAEYFAINLQDSIVIQTPKTGVYDVSVVAKAGGTTPGALYTIYMRTDGTVQSQIGGLTSVPDFGVTETTAGETEPYSFGDANNDRTFNIADVTFLINWIFGGGSGPVILAAADSNCDGGNNIADVTFDIARIFAGGKAPGCE